MDRVTTRRLHDTIICVMRACVGMEKDAMMCVCVCVNSYPEDMLTYYDYRTGTQCLAL